jgi:hypothetical protein
MRHIFYIHSNLTKRLAESIIKKKSIEANSAFYLVDKRYSRIFSKQKLDTPKRLENLAENQENFIYYTTLPNHHQQRQAIENRLCRGYYIFEEGFYSFHPIMVRYGGNFSIELIKGILLNSFRGRLKQFLLMRKKYRGVFFLSSGAFLGCKNRIKLNAGEIFIAQPSLDFDVICTAPLIFGADSQRQLQMLSDQIAIIVKNEEGIIGIKIHPGQNLHMGQYYNIVDLIHHYRCEKIDDDILIEDALVGRPISFYLLSPTSFFIYAKLFSNHRIFLRSWSEIDLPHYVNK